MQGPNLIQRLRSRWHAMVEDIDQADILRLLRADGQLTARYLFMVAIAAGIATIGLLLNSPAVIIGAMLISPLMGPIALTGAAVATLSAPHLRAGLTALAAGAVAALALAGLIVLFSPLHENTPEILARTRPNLFDLVVAVLSGLAGGYATVRGRGGAVVGVAIATALMPPLAVVAFGIVSRQWQLASGAGLLFLTNMVAIALAIALVLSCYGFARRETRSKLVWQTVLWGALLTPLAYPLTTSLQSIVAETFFAQRSSDVIRARIGDDGRIERLSLSFPDSDSVRVEAVVLLSEPVESLEQRVTEALQADSGRRWSVRIAQLQVADPAALLAERSAVANPVAAPAQVALVAEGSPLDGFPLPLEQAAIDHARRTALMVPRAGVRLPLATYRQAEAEAASAYPGWNVRVRPPLVAMPPVHFAHTSADIDRDAAARLDDIVWAVRAWGAGGVAVTGYASTEGGGNLPLAQARADNVAEVLRGRGLDVSIEAIYPAPEQHAIEHERGMSHFRRVEFRIRPIALGSE
ncbi:MAG: DUF389 domain-containing protein [Zoogloeaceae bacterium]|nr:DUF389 domain-containing protein [Rhodocyclaceae bacterium]MCP5235637.1 DUF389 domain-containing protein [Zoogloeaceae bacterium]